MRVWVDLTNSPHVLVMRPLIEAMRADGHEVEVTARDFAQTLELCERLGIEHTAIGRHRGGRLDKALGLVSRSGALARWARGRRFDVAMGHGSNDVSVAAALLRIPSATAFDYELAAVQHQVNCRLCARRGGARGDPARAAGALRRRGQAAPLPGPQGGVLPGRLRAGRGRARRAGPRPRRPLVVVRTPPEVSLYHRFENPLFRRVLERLAGEDAQTVVLPRTPEQREEVARLGRSWCPSARWTPRAWWPSRTS